MKKIKIAHVITRLILGGAQENTLLTVEGLQGYDDCSVDLITGPALGPEGSLFERAHLNNVSLIEIPEMRRNIHFWRDCVTLIKLFNLFRKKRYDVIHSHSSKAGIICRVAAFLAGCKIIVHTIHGLPFHPYQSNFLNTLYIFLEKICAVVTKKIAVVCPEMSRKALAQGIGTPEKFVTVYSGIETEQYKSISKQSEIGIRQQYGIPNNAIVVGKIARLFHLKGHKYLLPAAKMIIDKYPDVYFLLVGDGVLHDILKEKSRELGIEKNIIFTGLIASQSIPEYINVMDIVVHLSLREGLPRVVPQSFLLGKPVIAYDVDGAKDIIDNEKNGFLLPPKEVEILSQKIEYLLKNPDVAQKMGKEGEQKAWKLFPHEKMVSQLHALYHELSSCT